MYVYIYNIWGADLADMQLISKFNKGFRFLLCVYMYMYIYVYIYIYIFQYKECYQHQLLNNRRSIITLQQGFPGCHNKYII